MFLVNGEPRPESKLIAYLISEKWKTFFNDAGVPTNEIDTYASKFALNRIQTDMLVDLNKDYLNDMGITIIGDVIAILRRAKQVSFQI
jgi:hypothetical protein